MEGHGSRNSGWAAIWEMGAHRKCSLVCVCVWGGSRGSRGQRRPSGCALKGPLREEVAESKAGSSFMSFDEGEPQHLPWTGSPEDRGPVRKVVSPSSECHPSL